MYFCIQLILFNGDGDWRFCIVDFVLGLIYNLKDSIKNSQSLYQKKIKII